MRCGIALSFASDAVLSANNKLSRVQKHLNLSPDNPKISDSLKQTLTGFISIICGLSGLSDRMGDRHFREYKAAAHHAALIVNAAMTFSNFIFDTYAYQKVQDG